MCPPTIGRLQLVRSGSKAENLKHRFSDCFWAWTKKSCLSGIAPVKGFAGGPVRVPKSGSHDFLITSSEDASVCGELDAASGLVANTVLYGLPKTNTFEVRQMIRSNSTNVRIFSRYFHNTRC
jgi:hypothetical protein